MAASHSCVVLPLCLLLTCLSLTGAVVSEQQHVIVHHEPNNHDLLPYEISLIGRDVHLRQSLGGHHDRRPSVPAFVVAKMDAESIPRLAHAPSTKGPLRHPNPRDPEVPVLVSVRSEADPSQGRRRESYNNEVTPLKPSKMAVDPIVPIAVAPPTPRVNNYHRVLNRVLEQDIPLLHESPRSKGPIDLPDHQLNMKSPSAYASKMVPHIIRQVKNITLHYHVTNYHPASYAKSAGKRGQSPTTTTTPSPTTAPTDATTTTPEAAKEKASEEEMPSYVPSASEIMAAFLQGPLEQQLKMLQDVPVIQRRREVPNTSFTRSMATRNLRRSYHDRSLAMDSRVRRVRRRYPRRHAGFSERSYDVMGAASDEQPVKAEESTSSPVSGDKKSEESIAVQHEAPTTTAQPLEPEVRNTMYEHQEYQSFPYQPAPNFKKYIPEPDSPAPVPMTEYMRPRIAYRPTAEQLRQAQYQAENAAAQSQANVEQVKINDEDGDLDQQQEQQRQEDFNQEPEADQAPAQRPLSQYAQYQAPQSRPRDILYDDDLEDSRLRQRDQYRRQKEREEREREARDREEQERQERDREEKVRQEREEQEREVQERELQEKERQVRERKARQERGQYLARERQLAAIREQRRLNGDQYRQEQEAPSAAARRPFDTKGASGQTGRGPVQQADREQYAEQLRSGPQLGDQAEEEGRDEREPESRPAAGMPLNLAYSRPVTQERQEGEEEAAAGGRPKPSYPVAQSAEKDSLAEGKDGHTLVGYLPLVHVPYPRPRYHLPQFAPAAITQKLIGSTKGDQDQYGRQATHRPADQVQQQQQQQQQFSEPTVPIIQLRKKKEKTVPLLTINLKQRPYASAA